MNLICPETHGALKKLKSTPTPVLMFGELDNYILNHLNDSFLDQANAIELTKEHKIYFDTDKLKGQFNFDLLRTILTSDGAPRNKYTGIKAGAHRLRIAMNLQDIDLLSTIYIQNSIFLLRLKDYWNQYEIEQKELDNFELSAQEIRFGRSPLFWEYRNAQPTLGNIFIGVSYFHACAQGAETASDIITKIIDVNSKPYKEISKALAQWDTHTGKGNHVYGAQMTFSTLYKLSIFN